jgi:hypothetical protein
MRCVAADWAKHDPPDSQIQAQPGVFSVTGVPLGSLYPRRLTVTWNRGQLTGDAALIAAARDRAAALEGEQVGPQGGPYSGTNHLASPIAASTILADLFVPGTVTLAGDVPVRPPPPTGAVG